MSVQSADIGFGASTIFLLNVEVRKIAAAQAGDGAAFTEVLENCRPAIVRVARRYFRRFDEIEEVVHLSVIEVWRDIGGFNYRGPHSFQAWLARITANTCHDMLRRQRRNRESLFSQFGENEADFFIPVSPGRALEERAIHRDLTNKLLLGLEPDDRLVFTLLKSENFSVSEIAEMVGWSETKVKMRVHRAKSVLRRKSRRLV